MARRFAASLNLPDPNPNHLWFGPYGCVVVGDDRTRHVYYGGRLTVPAEAKKLLANVLAAPGHVTVTTWSIKVHVAPAAVTSERIAIRRLLDNCNRKKLTLPGDPRGRPLPIQLQNA